MALVTEDIETTTQDSILKKLGRELKGHPFEYFVADLFEALGYKTRVTQASGDMGVDVIAPAMSWGSSPRSSRSR